MEKNKTVLIFLLATLAFSCNTSKRERINAQYVYNHIYTKSDPITGNWDFKYCEYLRKEKCFDREAILEQNYDIGFNPFNIELTKDGKFYHWVKLPESKTRQNIESGTFSITNDSITWNLNSGDRFKTKIIAFTPSKLVVTYPHACVLYMLILERGVVSPLRTRNW
jgi:hypothetical protein